MSRPPASTPHSDLEGVHRDERPNIETAKEAGQDSADLERAGDQSVARPPYAEDDENLDNRSG